MFAGTIVLSAFLLFLVQPLIAKILLPWFGGSTGVWATCVVFFQVMLVFGYAYAHALTTYLTPRQQMLTHLSVLGLAALAAGWSIMPGESWRPENSDLPILKLGMLLLRYVGLPYFALATTGPLVQAWFARLFPGKTPYRLYALSNFGSLASLLLFPTVFEQFFGLSFLSTLWSGLFWVFAALAAGVAYLTNRETPSEMFPDPALEQAKRLESAKKQSKLNKNELPTSEVVAEPTWASYMLWLVLPALASFMLVAGTNHLCQDVASVPFLWVLPLSLYLLSFIICFDHERWYQRLVFAVVALAGLYISAGMYPLDFKKQLSQGLLVRGTWPVTRPFYEKMDWYARPEYINEILEYPDWIDEQTRNVPKFDPKSSDIQEKYKNYVVAQEEQRFRNWLSNEKQFHPGADLDLPASKAFVDQQYREWVRHRPGSKWLEAEQDIPIVNINFIGQILAHCVGLFGLFMICHGELTRRKPPARYLTSFYMMIAIGGAIGGALVSLAAPFIFSTYAEWILGLIIALLLTGGLLLDQPGDGWYKTRFFLLALPAAVLCLYMVWQNSDMPEMYLQLTDPQAHEDFVKSNDPKIYNEYLNEVAQNNNVKGPVPYAGGQLLGAKYVIPLVGLLLAIIGVGFYALSERSWQREKLRYWVVNLALLLVVCFAVYDSLNFLGFFKGMEDFKSIFGGNKANQVADEDGEQKRTIFQGRNFYGALSIVEYTYAKDEDTGEPSDRDMRQLMHGRILHGNQFVRGPLRSLPTTYYTQDSGVGRAIGHVRGKSEDSNMHIGAIGLGTGTIAAYGKQPGQDFTIYEINPLVEQLSATDNGFFQYIPDARKLGCKVEIVLGDARVQLQREAKADNKRNFDVLVVDAFSGDSIPTHLLTREAMDAYLQHMRSDQSIIAIHISNRYLNLRPVCRGLAEYAKLDGTVVVKGKDDGQGGATSTWVLLTNDRDFLDKTIPQSQMAYGPIKHKDIASILWTDDYTTLMNVLHGTGSSSDVEPETTSGH
jgi:hypothetical protein